ncbi:MAG: hypothetical protein ABI569_13230 [Casimicrobiaceae bacterium]
MQNNDQTYPLTPRRLRETIRELQDWVESHDYKGYEPFDGLSSWLRPLTFEKSLPLRLLQQFVRQSPINVRPMVGVRPQESTKGRGYMALGYLTLYKIDQRQEYLEKAVACLEWLDKHKVPRFAHHSWSNHFDFAGRGGTYTSNDPIIVWTSSIGHAYVDAFEATGKPWFLQIARSVCDWIMELPRERTSRGDCLSYLADQQITIHNANMLGAAILARTANHCGNEEYRRVARSAMEYSCTRQRSDGSWWYAEEDKFHWIDNFHTGYNLDSLKHYIDATGDAEFRSNLDKGLEFFVAHFFESDGCPRYYHDRKYPVDIQCAAQAIDTLATFGATSPRYVELAQKVTAWTIDNMRDQRGYFYYRKYPLVTSKTPMLHWGQATMFKGLCQLEYALHAARGEHVGATVACAEVV